MASWFAKVGAALGLDKDTRSLDAALDEDSARAARGVTPISDVVDRSHALVFGTLLGMTYPPEEGAQRVLVATLYDGTDTLELRWPGRSSIPGLSVGQRLEVDGTVGRVGERLVIINPPPQRNSPGHEPWAARAASSKPPRPDSSSSSFLWPRAPSCRRSSRPRPSR